MNFQNITIPAKVHVYLGHKTEPFLVQLDENKPDYSTYLKKSIEKLINLTKYKEFPFQIYDQTGKELSQWNQMTFQKTGEIFIQFFDGQNPIDKNQLLQCEIESLQLKMFDVGEAKIPHNSTRRLVFSASSHRFDSSQEYENQRQKQSQEMEDQDKFIEMINSQLKLSFIPLKQIELIEIQEEEKENFAEHLSTQKSITREVIEPHPFSISSSIHLQPMEPNLPKNTLTRIQKFGIFTFLPKDYPKIKDSEVPLYLTAAQLKSTIKGTSLKERFENLKRQPNNEMLCVDNDYLSRLKGVMLDAMKRIAKEIYNQTGNYSVSLPARIFEPVSTIKRYLEVFGFSNTYLTKAAKLSDPVERFRLVITYVMSGYHLGMNFRKPFNPLLGETFEGCQPDGTLVYGEQISHHPPTSAFQLYNAHWKQEGRLTMYGRFSGNYFDICNEGSTNVTFKDGQVITFTTASQRIGGAIFGSKTLKQAGTIIIYDRKSRLKAVIEMNSQPSQGFFSTKLTDIFTGKFYQVANNIEIFPKYPTQKKMFAKEKQMKDIYREIGDIEGSWLDYLKIGGKEYWNVKNGILPLKIQYKENPLPSDGRFHEDLIWVYHQDFLKAQEWKFANEIQQRLEKKLRAQTAKALAKKTKKKH